MAFAEYQNELYDSLKDLTPDALRRVEYAEAQSYS